MTKLSININKIATLRNSRGGNNPDLIKTALDIERFGGEGITVHPRPDERHIRYADVYALKEVIDTELNIGIFKNAGVRTSIFVDPVIEMIEGAAATGTDRIELYTESFAKEYAAGNKAASIKDYVAAAVKANELGLGINAGHDLDLQNLQYFAQHIPGLLEVSIGHALICDALYLGLENTVQLYKRRLNGRPAYHFVAADDADSK
jgi:pyridoxine 5-phosphate synthase